MLEDLTPIAQWRDVDMATFRGEIVPRGAPAVLRGLAAAWPAVAAGRTPEGLAAYLKPFASPGPVEVLAGPPAIKGHLFYRDDMSGLNFERSRRTLATVIDALLGCAGDAAPPAISLQSLPVPEALPGFEGDNRIDLLPASVVPRLWLGNKVTVAPHIDLNDNIACVVAGRRRFVLFPPEQLPNLYVGPFDFSPAGAPVSMVPLGPEPDLERFPRYEKALAAAQTALLEPGDAIYIPYMWWHGVQSLEPVNMLVNYWWNEARPAGSPFDVLMHALIVLKDLPPGQRAVWREMFDHYIFEVHGEPMAHLAPEHRGALGGLDADGARRMRAILALALSRP
jgi:hypothetical protein